MPASPRTLPALLAANLVASALHFTHNMLFFDRYPEPEWITGPHVVGVLWLLITPLLAAGWWLARRGKKWASITALCLYGVLSMFALGHYFYGSPMDMTLPMNILIAAEAVAAGLLIVAAPSAVGTLPPAPRRDQE